MDRLRLSWGQFYLASRGILDLLPWRQLDRFYRLTRRQFYHWRGRFRDVGAVHEVAVRPKLLQSNLMTILIRLPILVIRRVLLLSFAFDGAVDISISLDSLCPTAPGAVLFSGRF